MEDSKTIEVDGVQVTWNEATLGVGYLPEVMNVIEDNSNEGGKSE